MGTWRFHRRLRLVPGFTLNLGKHAASLSVGVRGLHTTFGKRNRTTIGLPGSGLSYTILHGRRLTRPAIGARLLARVAWLGGVTWLAMWLLLR